MDIEKVLAPWGIGLLQDACAIHRRLKVHRLSWEDVDRFVQERAVAKRKWNQTMVYLGIPCVNRCGSRMLLVEVNSRQNNQIGGDAKSMWWCPNPDCNATVTNTKTVQEEMILQSPLLDAEKKNDRKGKRKSRGPKRRRGTHAV